MKTNLLTGAMLILTVTAMSQDMRDNLSRSLFSDQKANRVGDAVTILVVETSSASNNAQTNSSRASRAYARPTWSSTAKG